jgi:predicted DNA binding CopG/RHH family protein
MKKSNGKKRNKEQELLVEADEWSTGKRGSHSIAATEEDEAALDEAMELQMISIRLPQSVVENLKTMAKKEGIGYQPYTRQVLIHHTQGNDGTAKLHDLEERLKSVERMVFKKTAGR